MTAEADPCPVCAGREWVPAGEAVTLGGRRHAYHRCRRCHLVGLMGRRPSDEADDYYRDGYYAQDESPATWRAKLRTRLESSRSPHAQALLMSVSTAYLPLPSSPGARLLDVGCGGGGTLVRAQALGWDAEGCELSDATANRARLRGFVCHAVDWAAALPSRAYECILASHVIEHLERPGDGLRALSRALAAGGTLHVSVPNFGCSQARAFGLHWWGVAPPEHLWLLEHKHLRCLVRDAGLTVVGVREQTAITGAFRPGTVRLQWAYAEAVGISKASFARRYLAALGVGAVARRRDPAAWPLVYTLVCRLHDERGR